MSGVEACRILASLGITEVRKRGSHIIMRRKNTTGTVTAPVPDHRKLRIGTPRSVIRKSGLPVSLFEE